MYLKIAFIFWFCFLMLTSHSQKSFRVYTGLGSTINHFQNARFSDIRFLDPGFALEFGFEMENSVYTLESGVSVMGLISTHPATSLHNYSGLWLNVSTGYYRSFGRSWKWGGGWNLFDYTIYDTPDLVNSSNTFISASDWFVGSRYNLNLNDDFSLSMGGDLGLISVVKVAPSFTANFQQKVVDDGLVSYTDYKARQPIGFANLDPMILGQQVLVKTIFDLRFRKRFSLAYMWRMRMIREIKSYPVTQGLHRITLRWHFISKSK
jgi:hypothetical protein